MIRLFVIEYAGGSVALDASWFNQSELEEFQKQISLMKGSSKSTPSSLRDNENGQQFTKSDPIQILKSRLVKGEITPQEYRKMKSFLEEERK